MDDPTLVSRLQFAFTLTYHYLFPQLTMGLALLLVIFKTLYLRTQRRAVQHRRALLGQNLRHHLRDGRGHRHPHGVPVRHQLGALLRRTGAIIAQTLAMEGAFAFFLESAFLGIFLFGERLFGQRMHWLAAVLVWLGTWLSGCFIIATNAWMQHPVGYTVLPDGTFALTRLLGGALQLLDRPPVPAHHERRGDHRQLRDGRPRRLLPAGGPAPGLRQDLRDHRRDRRASSPAASSSSPAATWKGGRWRTISRSSWRRWRDCSTPSTAPASPSSASRTRRSSGWTTPLIVPERAQLPHLRRWNAEVKGLDAVPAQPVAGQRAVRLLRLSHHGRAGHDLHGDHGPGRAAALAAAALRGAPDALAADAGDALPLHRQHRRLADGRAWPPALDRLRPAAHRRGHLADGLRRQRAVHPARLRRHVSGAGPALRGAGGAGGGARPAAGGDRAGGCRGADAST